jgi:hypothetical protein
LAVQACSLLVSRCLGFGQLTIPAGQGRDVRRQRARAEAEAEGEKEDECNARVLRMQASWLDGVLVLRPRQIARKDSTMPAKCCKP